MPTKRFVKPDPVPTPFGPVTPVNTDGFADFARSLYYASEITILVAEDGIRVTTQYPNRKGPPVEFVVETAKHMVAISRAQKRAHEETLDVDQFTAELELQLLLAPSLVPKKPRPGTRAAVERALRTGQPIGRPT